MTAGWSVIKFVFSRPLIASVIVGTMIHSLLELNEHLLKGACHLDHLADDMTQNPGYGAIYLLIPFLVPYVVTRIGSRIRMETETSYEWKFPQANPDIVIKLDPSGEIIFINTAAKLILKRMGMDEADSDILLPKDSRTIVEEILGTDRLLGSLIHQV